MIEVSGLTKSYGSKQAVQNISFSISEGEIVGFLGPNGAGKSTTMNILTGYLSATGGTVKINGVDIEEEPLKVRKMIGYLPEQPPLYMDMTVKEYLNFVYDLKKVKLSKVEHIAEVCRLVDIEDVASRMIRNLSKGYKQRVGLAGALIGNPSVLILDEPTVGLDPKQIIEIRSLIQNLGMSRTVILSSHILPEIQAVCERVLVINQGEIVADGTPESLSEKLTGHHRLQMVIEGDQDKITQVLSGVAGVTNVSILGVKGEQSEYIIDTTDEADIRRDVFDALAQQQLAILSMKSMDISLEDIFLKLTEDDAEADNDAGEQLSEDGANLPSEDNTADAIDLSDEVETLEETQEGTDDDSNLEA